MKKIKISPRAAWEFLRLAKDATKNGGRSNWLWAYDRYDFTQSNRLLQRRLKAVADLFRKLEAGKAQ